MKSDEMFQNRNFAIVYFLDCLSNLEMPQTMRLGVTLSVYSFLVLFTGLNWNFSLNLWSLQITALIELVGLEQGHSMSF